MLKRITIKNYALIREIELVYGSGLNIITGETGAGKSIIIGALGLILGNRADVTVLRDKTKKCYVEASFDMDEALLSSFFEEHDLDLEDNLILRRQISPQGKSRAFINDTPVKLGVLRDLSSMLIDVNSQHQTFSLNNSGAQLNLLDDYALNQELIQEYKSNLAIYKSSISKLHEIEDLELKAKAEQDFLQFQFDELENIDLEKGEFSILEQEAEVLNNAEEIKSQLFSLSEILDSDNQGVLNNLAIGINNIRNVAAYHLDYSKLHDRLESVFLEVKDISSDVEAITDQVNFDPSRFEEVSNRLDQINNLVQKHRLDNANDLLSLKDKIEDQLLNLDRLSVDKESLSREIQFHFDKITNLSDQISNNRHKIIEEVQTKIKKSLKVLGMEGADFIVDLQPAKEFKETGKDLLQFLFTANKGIEAGPISKIASGGELSRLMLSLKNILTSRKSVSSIIFDEIDTGVSGDIAGKVGDMMKEMGSKMQIIAITHLPQIAAKANQHYKVFKAEDQGVTYSLIKQLNESERLKEVSVMIGGKMESQAVTTTARELMNN